MYIIILKLPFCLPRTFPILDAGSIWDGDSALIRSRMRLQVLEGGRNIYGRILEIWKAHDRLSSLPDANV